MGRICVFFCLETLAASRFIGPLTALSPKILRLDRLLNDFIFGIESSYTSRVGWVAPEPRLRHLDPDLEPLWELFCK